MSSETGRSIFITSPRVYLPNSPPTPCTIHILDDRIHCLSLQDRLSCEPQSGDEVIQTPLSVVPGMIDAHVHINSPGRTHWEGFKTASLAALSGGITTLFDMPLNSLPPTCTLEAWKLKKAAYDEFGRDVNVSLWGGIVPDSTPQDVEQLMRVGVRGFKCFLCPSGVDEFPPMNLELLEKLCSKVTEPILILFHAEIDSTINDNASSDPKAYSTFLASRPASSEQDAITSIVLPLLRLHKHVSAHIVHLSSSDSIPILLSARSETPPLKITAETTHHYLSLKEDEIMPCQVQYKCCPPIRSASNAKGLWEALKAGHINIAVSDHSPCPPDLKSDSFMDSWGGVASLGLGLNIIRQLADTDIYSANDLRQAVEFYSTRPAEFVGLKDRGSIMAGAKADLAFVNEREEWTLQPEMLNYKHRISPYIGKKFTGKVRQTWISGKLVWCAEKGIMSGQMGGLL